MKKEETRGRKSKPTISSKIDKFKNKKDGAYHFLYNIPTINQYAIVKNGWELDIIDIAIYYCIENFISQNKSVKMDDPKTGTWYFVSEKIILSDMPLLPLSSENAVYKRITNLIKYGLIDRYKGNSTMKSKYIRIGESSRLLLYSKYTPIK